jgi:hypothetical protein
MTDRLDFEGRLEDRLRARAAIASRPFDAVAIAHQAALAGGRRRAGPSLRLADRPALRWALLAAVALSLLAAAIVAGSLLRDRSSLLAGTGRWIATSPMQDLHDDDRAPSAMLLDGRVLFVGGAQDSEVASSELFDPATNTFSRTAGVLAELRHGHSVTTLADGRVLVAGGRLPAGLRTSTLLDTAELFDPATGTFSPTGRMVIGREAHVATLLADGRVLVMGEFGAGDTMSAETFDPGTGSWSLAGTMLHSRFALAATLLQDGRVLASGGMDSMETTELFDPATGLFEAGPSMANPRYGHASVRLADGRVLIIGGSDGDQAISSVEVYDPATGRISPTGSLVTERIAASAVLLADGRVLVAGGTLANDAPLSAELYDPNTGTFQQAAFATRMHIGVAHRLLDGRVLVTGDQPEVFDPSATMPVPTVTPRSDRIFIATGEPIEDRGAHSATRLHDGRILIIGGQSSSVWGSGREQLASAEIYDPKTGSFTATGAMRVSPVPDVDDTVFGHSALLLSDGRVLVIGDRRFSWGVQIFDPATGVFSDLGSLGPEAVTVGQPIAAVQLVDGRILLFGPPLDQSSTIDSDALAYELDLAQLRATKIADLRGCHGVDVAVALADGRVVLQCAYGGVRETRVFDPRTGGSSTLDLPSTEFRAMVVLADGRVLFTGEGETTSLTIYDPATGRTVASGTLPAFVSDDRQPAAPSLTVLNDGLVLVIGGRVAILWDPSAATASTLPSTLANREGHTATLLDDGRVLVFGGTRWPTDRGVPLPLGAELFDPSALP